MKRPWQTAKLQRPLIGNRPAPHHLTPPIVVAVLAGGQSRRMGRDKAAIELDEMSLLERVCRAASDAGLPVIVVGRETSSLPVSVGERYTTIPDDSPGCGPLGGLATALCHTPGSSILLCAIDLPQIRSADFNWLAAQAAATIKTEWNGVVPVWHGRPEPLFAVYHTRVLPLVNLRLSRGQLAMRGLIDAGDFQLVALPGSHAGAVADVDTPEDLRDLNIINNLDNPPE